MAWTRRRAREPRTRTWAEESARGRGNEAPRLSECRHAHLNEKIGASERIRTLNPDLGKVVLYP